MPHAPARAQLDWQLIGAIDISQLLPGPETSACLCSALAAIVSGSLSADADQDWLLPHQLNDPDAPASQRPVLARAGSGAASPARPGSGQVRAAVAVRSAAQFVRVAQACLQMLCFGARSQARAVEALALQLREGNAALAEASGAVSEVRKRLSFLVLELAHRPAGQPRCLISSVMAQVARACQYKLSCACAHTRMLACPCHRRCSHLSPHAGACRTAERYQARHTAG